MPIFVKNLSSGHTYITFGGIGIKRYELDGNGKTLISDDTQMTLDRKILSLQKSN